MDSVLYRVSGVPLESSIPPVGLSTQELIADECDRIRDLLLDKNRKYGDSALNPVRVFSRCNAIEQINVRIDDKLSRLKSAQDDDTEDTELDLLGYLILKRVAIRRALNKDPQA